LKEAVIEVCHSLRDHRRANLNQSWDNALGDLVIRQVDLGQRATIAGVWDPEWSRIQSAYHRTIRSRKKGRTWLVRVIHRIQALVRNMWKRRNKELHEKESCEAKVKEHDQLNEKIDTIFNRKRTVSNRCMTHGAAAYFKKNKDILKKMRIKRKREWVRDAEEILDSLTNQSEQAKRFLKYFQFRDEG
jgi:hypothetical protein